MILELREQHLWHTALIHLKIERGKSFHVVTRFFPAEGIVSKVLKSDGRIGVNAEAGLSGTFAECKVFAQIL